jgi:hypothetical protein
MITARQINTRFLIAIRLNAKLWSTEPRPQLMIDNSKRAAMTTVAKQY